MLKAWALWMLAALPAFAAMPVAQENALVAKYCTVCHTDAVPGGSLSLQHFDAAHPDPGVAAMMASKLRGQALGASGKPLPDRITQDELLAALVAQSAGAEKWTVTDTTVSIVREVHARAVPDLYRLTLTCRADTGAGEIQVAWSPDVPRQGEAVSAVVDGKTKLQYTVEGFEKMGNGSSVVSGPGALLLRAMPLPKQTLTISNIFPGAAVQFPVSELNQTARQALSKCFSSPRAADVP